MRRTVTLAITVAFLVAAATGCGSSSSKGSSSTSTTATKPSSGSAGSGSSAKTPAEFCSLLATDTEKTAAFAASIGTPEQTAKLAEIKADNDAILAAAPADIHDAVSKVYAVSDLARAALDPTLSAGDKAAKGAQAATAAGTPEVKAAIADYKTWVQSNCGSLAPKILSGGL